jgi:hypothetical protein
MPDLNNNLYKLLGAIEAKQESILDEVRDMKVVMREELKATNTRVEKLEVVTTNLRIKWAAAGSFGALLTLLLTELFKRSGGQ